MKTVAYIYTCRNPGQVALLWAHQPPPFGHGWIDVKRVGLVREDEVEALQHELAILMDQFHMYPWCCEYAGNSRGFRHNHSCKNWQECY